MRRAVFPGSFDPITIGHEDIIKRALPLFDEIIIAIGFNSTKGGMYSIEERMQLISDVFAGEEKIKVDKYQILTIDYCHDKKANYLLRGLRTAADFEFERGIGQVNRLMADDIETVFMLTAPEYTPISSSIVRDVIRHKGNLKGLVPESILDKISL
ncbi:MAG: pantetheine-phosphate adenylyltransferase [Bacteroidetes bacterium]|nr:MAG: pantetheine-phosphate adenylyltransferase [Bacteroidota bacterium]